MSKYLQYLNPYNAKIYPKDFYAQDKLYVRKLYNNINQPSRGKWLNSIDEKLADHEYMKKVVSELRFCRTSFFKYSSLDIPKKIPYIFYSPFQQEADFIRETLAHDQKKLNVYVEHNIDYEELRKKTLSAEDYSSENEKIEKEMWRLRDKEIKMPNPKLHRSLIFENEKVIKRISGIYSNEGYRDLKFIKKEQAKELNIINRRLYHKAISTSKIKGKYRFNVLLYLLKWLVGGNFYFHDYLYELNREIIDLLNSEGPFPYRGNIARLNELRLEGGQKYFKIRLLDHIISRKKEGKLVHWKGLINDSVIDYEYYHSLKTGDEKMDQKILDFLNWYNPKHPENIVRYYITFKVINSNLNLKEVHKEAKNKEIPRRARDISYNTFNWWVKKWEEFLKPLE